MAPANTTGPTSHEDKHPKTTIIDKRGDLWLLVGEEVEDNDNPATQFHVCSKTLARSSPVLEAMLFGSFAESRLSRSSSDGEPWIVKLPADASASMGRLLAMLHNGHIDERDGNNHKSPSFIYTMTCLIDKYDCFRAVRPWALEWCRDHERHMSFVCSSNEAHAVPCECQAWKLTWTAFQLGDLKSYENIMGILIKHFPAWYIVDTERRDWEANRGLDWFRSEAGNTYFSYKYAASAEEVAFMQEREKTIGLGSAWKAWTGWAEWRIAKGRSARKGLLFEGDA
ncbi:hypothetical protein Micbo1qcDRAFT_212503, partial [Microdochium bolleyi]